MNVQARLKKLEAAKIRPGFCACAQIEHRYLKPLEEPVSIHCDQCGFPRMTIWVSTTDPVTGQPFADVRAER